jgi:serine/threonine protein kinase
MAASPTHEWKFQPLFELGRGGVAVVRAERVIDENGRPSIVAVKRLLPLVAESSETRAMFLAEARLAALIDHPNVVKILAAGEQQEPFIAMDLVLGENLAGIIAHARERGEPPLDPTLALSVGAMLCDALHAAHEVVDPESGAPIQLVHRDVSPQNVLVGFDGTVKLSDFGIAKALGYGARTRTGDVKGKVPYMSPEQALGDPVDRRSDIFALGSVLYECISGRRMLGDGHEIDMLRKLATEPMPSIMDVWPAAPGRAVRLFASMVARDPSDRPSTAAEVAAEIRRILGAAHDPEATRKALAQRMSWLFPQGRETALARLSESEREAERQQPYLRDMETFADRPSVLFRERRRARAMLALGLAFLAAAVIFTVAVVRMNRTPAPPQVITVREPISAPSAVSLAPPAESATPPGTSARPSPPAVVRTAATSPKDRRPPPAPSPPPTHDGLDEHPF